MDFSVVPCKASIVPARLLLAGRSDGKLFWLEPKPGGMTKVPLEGAVRMSSKIHYLEAPLLLSVNNDITDAIITVKRASRVMGNPGLAGRKDTFNVDLGMKSASSLLNTGRLLYHLKTVMDHHLNGDRKSCNVNRNQCHQPIRD